MALRAFLALSILASSAGAGAQSTNAPAKPKKAPFSIGISTPTATVRAGSEVIVNIVLTNTSNRELNIDITKAQEPGEIDFALDVRDAKGNAAPHTTWGRRLQGDGSSLPPPMESSSLEVPLKRGKSTRSRIIVNRLYDVSQPGKYTIQVGRSDPYTAAIALSNTLTVTVIP